MGGVKEWPWPSPPLSEWKSPLPTGHSQLGVKTMSLESRKEDPTDEVVLKEGIRESDRNRQVEAEGGGGGRDPP